MLFDDDGGDDHGAGPFEDSWRQRTAPRPLSRGRRLAWRLAIACLVLGFAPLVLAIGSAATGGPGLAWGPFTLLALPLAALGVVMIAVLLVLSIPDHLRGPGR